MMDDVIRSIRAAQRLICDCLSIRHSLRLLTDQTKRHFLLDPERERLHFPGGRGSLSAKHELLTGVYGPCHHNKDQPHS